MTTGRDLPGTLRPPRRRRRRSLRWAIRLLAGGVIFALGVAVGDALDDNPQPGGSVTYVRTLEPLPLPPAEDRPRASGGG